MTSDNRASTAREYGVQRVPVVVMDGTVAGCCRVGGVSREQLQAAGIGQRV